ncbi:hypothetical protein TPHA_0F02640 [Tetrapisispora phaffii CBS 4417]|uniref:3-hydroxyisobutyryl-CoA hydrolase n=1 Tax=Tetrapisispora phaffii (strain ATCC 24235 / CBS 4417 / NBRC 1672 / NRRL Y-8282 / UCD 70-5) TaxID=1071381 RepID=G8BUF8_TETPH|nr:hypothetical protein TPHA_0F02640 [Tetrapisispora phaffii CBS 4417]CCE63744.1 hypothetical protein TPHA_0F02640 [Tetrapisispora phaffii CBS 4417]
MDSKYIGYSVDGPCFIIKINDPKHLNSISFEDFIYIGRLLEIANNDASIIYTIIQSTGNFFSAGGKIESVLDGQSNLDRSSSKKLTDTFGMVAKLNVLFADAFLKHKKILICCLNGPAIGLSAAMVLLCDIVYGKDNNGYLLFPFSNLGFVAELGTSVTLFEKLGYNSAMEHLIFSSPVSNKELIEKNIIVKNYNLDNTDVYNKQVILDLKDKSKKLYGPSILGMKKMIFHESTYKQNLTKSQALETSATLPFWLEGEPFKRFQQMKNKERKHKL